MRVSFRRHTERRPSSWEAVRGERTRRPGPTMGPGRGGMPHDLTQLVVEATAGIEHGFWGCFADGATFRSTGRRRTRRGRAVIAAHRTDLDRAEVEVGLHAAAWRAGHDSGVTRALRRFDGLWAGVGDEGELAVEWPTLRLLST